MGEELGEQGERAGGWNEGMEGGGQGPEPRGPWAMRRKGRRVKVREEAERWTFV